MLVLNIHRIFWEVYGSSEYYERILGIVESISEILLWIPRTMPLGAGIAAIVMTSMVFMNIFCNVPDIIAAKRGSSHIVCIHGNRCSFKKLFTLVVNMFYQGYYGKNFSASRI